MSSPLSLLCLFIQNPCMLYNDQYYPGNKELNCISNQRITFFFLNLYLLCLYSHSIPPEVSYHRQELHRKHVSGYDFSWLSTNFRSIKVHRNMWTFLQNHKQLWLSSSQTDSCPAQHIMESSQRLQVPVPDQAIKTPQFRDAFSDNPIFLTSKPKEGSGPPSTRAIRAGKCSSFWVSQPVPDHLLN